MRVAVSMIGWEAQEDAAAWELVSAAGAGGIEVAPTRVWGSWEAATDGAIDRWRDELENYGLRVPAVQSLFYGVDAASLTGERAERRRATDQLVRVAGIAGRLGAGAAVLGSPAHRRRGDLPYPEARRRAIDTVRGSAQAFGANGVVLGIEPNPPQYGCDFLTTYAEVEEFVAELDHDSVAPHLDLGALRIGGESPVLAGRRPAHVHLSAPNLEVFDGTPHTWHVSLLERLRGAGYDGWTSIEQRPSPAGLRGVEGAIRTATALVGDG